MTRSGPSRRAWSGPLAAFGAGLVLWLAASLLLEAPEPWDSPLYWAAYLAGLVLSAVFGFIVRKSGWLCGVLIIFAQLPVLLFQSEPGPLLMVGILFLAALAVPAALVAIAAARFRPA